jgi:hypothetical protein
MSAAPPTPTPPDDFVQSIQNSDSLQLIGVIANCSGILSSGLAFISFVQGLGEPDNSTLLSAIDQLQQTLETDFTQLGNLITEQTKIVVDTVNRDAMAGALANSDVASDRIQAFLSGNDKEALETAETESIEAVQFFIELGLTSPPDLSFFLPGFMKAGTVRIFVIASEPSSVREPRAVLVENVSSMVTLLTTMVNSIKSTVNAAHTINEKKHTIQCALHPQVARASVPAVGPPHRTVTVIDGYYHEENGVALAFFDAQKNNPPCEQPSPFQAAALAAAQQSRTQGVTDELAFIGVPGFEQILQSWTNFLTAVTATPIKTVFNLNGTWASGGAAGPVIAVNGNLISVDMSAYKRPSAAGSILDSSSISVNFPDDKTYTGELQAPKTIHWSNNTVWTKV